MKKAITIKDMARKLNMSVSTVSKALNNDPLISTLTKERVKELAAKLNYVPDATALNFKLKKTRTIGLIIPDLLDQFFVQGINGVEKVAEAENYNVIVAQTHEELAKEQRIVDVMIRNRVDGVIASITKHTQQMERYEKLIQMGIPVVFFSRPPKSGAYHYVCTNSRDGALQAVQLFIEKGHQRIAHIMGPARMEVSQLRLASYKEALQKHHLPFDEALVKEADLTEASTRQAMQALLQLQQPPTAVLTFKNYISLHAIDYLKKHHPQLLQHIDFIGFGNLPLIQHLDHKPLASIDENAESMGIEAAQLLLRAIDADNDASTPPETIEVACRLVVH